MAISFTQVPATFRTFGIHVETDNSKANQSPPAQQSTILVIAPQLLSIHAVGSVVPVPSSAFAAANFGVGSIAEQMCSACISQDPSVPVYCAPVADAGGGTQAAGAFTFSGTATETRELALYIAGVRIAVAVVTGDTAAVLETKSVAAAQAADIAARLPVTVAAAGAGTAMDVTARHKGTFGNLIDLRHSHYPGERVPAGITVAITDMTGGATDPAITGALNGLGPNTRYSTIVHPYLDATNLTSLESNLDTRWNAMDQRMGHAFTAVGSRANDASSLTHAEIITLGNGRNSQHSTIFAGAGPSPTAPWVIAGNLAAAEAAFSDPAMPRRGMVLKDVVAPKSSDEWTWTQRNALYYDGIAAGTVVGGRVVVERVTTTYQVNGSNIPDPSYLDVETLRIAERIALDIRSLESRYARAKIANDGTRFDPNQLVLTPSIMRSEMLGLFRGWLQAAIIERMPTDSELICQRNAGDVGRMDVAISPDFMNQFRNMAVLDSFLL